MIEKKKIRDNKFEIDRISDSFEIFFLLAGIILLAIYFWGQYLLVPYQIHDLPIEKAEKWLLGLIFTGIFLSQLRDLKKPWAEEKLFLKTALLSAISYLLPFSHFTFIGHIFILCLLSLLLLPSIFAKTLYIMGISSLLIRGGLFFTQYLCWKNQLFSHIITWPACIILKIMGENPSFQGTLIHNGPFPIYLDSIKSGLCLFPLFMGALLAFFAVSNKKIKPFWDLIKGGLSLYLILIARSINLILTAPLVEDAGIFAFQRYYWSGLIFPVALGVFVLFFLIFKKRESREKKQVPAIPFGPFIPYGIMTGLIFSSGFALNYLPPISEKIGEVHFIIDEIRSDWEPSTIAFDWEIEGTFAENSYHSWIRLLGAKGPVTILTDYQLISPLPPKIKHIYSEKIDKRLLDSLDKPAVYVMKCPTEPYKEEEKEALENWIKEGGTLFAIGDHTNVYFMNDYLNQFTQKFGIKFDDDSTYLIDGGWLITEKSHRPQGAMRFLKEFVWATNCRLLTQGILPDILSTPVAFAGQIDYCGDFFFGNGRIDRYEPFGSMATLATKRVGKGAIIAFPDSTCFNNYLNFTPGRRELSASVASIAAGTEDPTFVLWPLATFIFALFIPFFWRGPLLPNLLIVLLALFFGLFLGFIATFLPNFFQGHFSLSPRLPERFLPGPEIIVDGGHNSAYSLDIGSSEDFMANNSYDGFIMDLGRLQSHFPRIVEGKINDKSLGKAQALIIVSPNEKHTGKEISQIYNSVKEGMNLILIEGARAESAINYLANELGLDFSLQSGGLSENYEFLNPTAIKGGESIINGPEGPIIVHKKLGNGNIFAIGDDIIFSRGSMVYGPKLRIAFLKTLELFFSEKIILKDELTDIWAEAILKNN